MNDWGTFSEVFGITPRNRILECFLESEDVDYSINDLAEQSGLDKIATARMIATLVKEGLVKLSRMVNQVQFFQLTLDYEEVKKLRKEFEILLDEVVKEYSVNEEECLLRIFMVGFVAGL